MSLLINQGKQDASNDNNFEPIEDKDVIISIEKIELNKFLPGNLSVTLRLMSGKYAKRKIVDLVPYEASNQFSWKYRALRKCAGCPYDENEPAQIDIELLLKDKVLMADFGINHSDEKNKDYQTVTYKVLSKERFNEVFPHDDTIEEFPDVVQNSEDAEELPTEEVDTATDTEENSTLAESFDNDDADWE